MAYVDVNAWDLAPVEVLVQSSEASFKCAACDNTFAVRNCEDFIKVADEFLKNQLVEREIEREQDEVEFAFETACPVCLKPCTIDLRFTLQKVKTQMLFSAKTFKKVRWYGLDGGLR